jgi:hypothetical protein
LRELTPGEVLQLRELLQMESNALAKAKAVSSVVTDNDLRKSVDVGIQAMEARMKGIQQFIVENNVISTEGVH